MAAGFAHGYGRFSFSPCWFTRRQREQQCQSANFLVFNPQGPTAVAAWGFNTPRAHGVGIHKLWNDESD